MTQAYWFAVRDTKERHAGPRAWSQSAQSASAAMKSGSQAGTATVCVIARISSMRIAALETSTEWCSVALWADGEIASLEQRAGHRHAERALPLLRQLLARCGIGVDALDAIAFGAGPGSFTGLRIACGVAQGLAMGRNLPVLGVSTLDAIAEESGAARVVVCLDARMREVYYACLERTGGAWRAAIAAVCVPPAAAPRPPGDDWCGCGNGFAAYPELLGPMVTRVLSEVHPSAVAIARLAAPRLAAGEGADAALAAPLYLRDKVATTMQERGAR
ncbi:MAG: tRNA (adenosine(37)-N6)-threonylcarbamoyltransferase complex dimerization subunit type 1 TsaB [Burkholderiales bacterium]